VAWVVGSRVVHRNLSLVVERTCYATTVRPGSFTPMLKRFSMRWQPGSHGVPKLRGSPAGQVAVFHGYD